MKFDPVDVVGEGCWHVLSRALAFIGCLWIGSFMGIVAIENIDLLTDPLEVFYTFLVSPLALVFTIWFPVTLALIIAAVFWFKSEKPLNIAAPVLMSAFSFIVVLGHDAKDSVAWVIWLVLQAMIATAAWFYTKHRHNRWLQEMEQLHIENDQRRAALKEAFGTESFDREIDDSNFRTH